ncbi:MAG: uracil permease [Epulopiscium sp. Nuni2H_MBin003]|nr:MAG: uracil permease [Epulopiscium sp. Nuni2H_MBin003]
METQANNTNSRDLVYQLEGRPPLAIAFPLGMQHVLAMFASNLAPILIIAGACGVAGADLVMMMQCAMLVSGLTTFVQLYPIKIGKNRRIGANLPIVMGTSFNFVPTAISVGATAGIGGVIGASLVGSLVEVFMGFFYKHIKRFFPPLVVGSTLTVIGIKLMSAGVGYFGGGSGSPDFGSIQNVSVAFMVLGIVVLLQRFGRGLWKTAALLVALVVGYIVAFFLGMVDTTSIVEAAWFSLPMPFQFKLTFEPAAILSFAALYVTSGLETIGNTSGIAIAGFDREATEEETSGGILADALGSTVAAVFNSLPNTAFGQNAGIVSMTKVVNKFCIATGAAMLVISSCIPKLGAVFAAIPASVMGGAIITVFSIILLNGMKMIAKAGFSERNLLVLGVTFALGLGIGGSSEVTANLPLAVRFVFSDSVTSTCIVAIILNVLFPITDEEEAERARKALLDA